jgi:general nucleoside transport system ATP-binding protein
MPRLALRDVHKRFGTSAALRGASLELEAGEVHALLGQNGAGKTTLVRVLYGLVRPDRGEIRIDDRPVEIRGPAQALALGIGLVHQHFMLVPALSVAENLALGEPGSAWLTRDALRARAEELLERYGLALDPDQPAGRLAVAQQQRLEIVRALARGVKVLVLDEPTAVLAPSEVSDLLALLARLREQGRTVVFISHKLGEITQVCDRVTVLRDGQTVETRAVAGLGAAELGRLMVGEAPPPPGLPVEAPENAPVALRLRNLRAPGLRGIDLEVRSGELVALAGIDGNGQQPLEEVLAGVRRPTGGSLELLAGPLALLPGDRQRTGLVLDLSVEENLALADAANPPPPTAEPFFTSGWLRAETLRRVVEEALTAFGVRARPRDPARALSGGNQQKLCVARALRGRSGVLVAVNPTRGLDLQATAAVRQALRQRARAGAAVLLISSDLEEVLELATRIAVFFRGALAPVEPERRTRERIGERMLGSA